MRDDLPPRVIPQSDAGSAQPQSSRWFRKSHFTEAQIIGMMKEEADMPTAEVCRRHGQPCDVLQAESQVWLHGGIRGYQAEGTGKRERQAEASAGRHDAR